MESEYTNRTDALKENQEKFRTQSRATRFVKNARAQKSSRAIGATPETQAVLSRFWAHKDAKAIIGTVVLLGALGIYGVFYAPGLAVKQVSIDDTQFINHDDVQNAVNDTLSQSLYYVIPQNRIVLLNTHHLESEIRARLGQPFAIESIRIEKQWGGKVHVSIKERIPGVTWVTHSATGADHFYTLDRTGVVTEQFDTKDKIRTNIPIVYDRNREVLGLNWHVMSNEYLNAIVSLSEGLKTMNIPIDSFELPPLVCKAQEYVAEKIFADEIANSESESSKTKKRDIQAQFKSGKLDIDQSLAALEQIKQEEETAAQAQSAAPTGNDSVTWATVNKETECDFVTVASDVYVVTPHDDAVWHGLKVKFDTKRSIDDQITQLAEGLKKAVPQDKGGIQYIDVRIPDRIYYK